MNGYWISAKIHLVLLLALQSNPYVWECNRKTVPLLNGVG